MRKHQDSELGYDTVIPLDGPLYNICILFALLYLIQSDGFVCILLHPEGSLSV